MRYALFLGVVAAITAWGGSLSETNAEVTFHCTWDAACPEITIAGDPEATLGGNPAPFRGYGDPSLENDPVTGTIWMSYSWLEVLVSSIGPPPVTDFGVETHLARSDDGGQTWTFVRKLNDNAAIDHPDTPETGWTSHEVSTIAKRGGDWEALWLTYFDPYGPPGYHDIYFQRSLAANPNALGDSAEPWADGWLTSPSFGAQIDFSAMPELSDCAAPTEPALLTHEGETYLAMNCVVIVGGERRPDLERLVLLKETPAGYEYIGVLLDYDDAVANGGERFEQVDLSIAENGAVLLIGTPITEASQPNHLGCKVFEVTDLEAAAVRRETSGEPAVLASITGEDDTIGAGLCTYDAASDTGVVMVLHSVTSNPVEVVFSMRATGVHPQGLDTDGDGLADSADPCPAFAPPWVTPDGDSDCDGYPDTSPGQPIPLRAPESVIGTAAGALCAATTAVNDEPLPDAWPPDFNDNQIVNVGDITALNAPFGQPTTNPPINFAGTLTPIARWDLNGSGLVNVSDVLQLNPFMFKRCA
jgi:hypothetical protein